MLSKFIFVGSSSEIGSEIVKKFFNEYTNYELIKVTRNDSFKDSKDFIYIKDYSYIDSVFSNINSTKNDIILLAFAYLGNTGYDNEIPKSLTLDNQKKVFKINLFDMITSFIYSINYLENKGGTLVFMSSAAAYPVRFSNFPYGFSKLVMDLLIKLLRPYLKSKKTNIVSVKIGFVPTPLNKGRKKTPFSTSKEVVSKAVIYGIKKNKKNVYVPRSIFFVSFVLKKSKRLSSFLDKKFNT